MKSSLRAGRILFVLLLSATVLTSLAGCGKPPKVIDPPQAPEGAAGALTTAAPKDLALARTDLPAGFQLTSEKAAGPEYFALYLRPGALDESTSGGNTLLSVLTYVAVYPTLAEAQDAFAKSTDGTQDTALKNAQPDSAAATDVHTETYAGAVRGADQSEANKVNYLLKDRRIYEYSHRVRLGNVLAYMVVSAIGIPEEPAGLEEDVRDLAQRQVDKIADAETR